MPTVPTDTTTPPPAKTRKASTPRVARRPARSTGAGPSAPISVEPSAPAMPLVQTWLVPDCGWPTEDMPEPRRASRSRAR